MVPGVRRRCIPMILVGVLGLVLKRWLSGSIPELVYNYLGNFSVSYAVYFLVILGADGRLTRLPSALIALIVVEAFEVTNGFGFMANVYDPFDYLANALGVALAYGVDLLLVRRTALSASG